MTGSKKLTKPFACDAMSSFFCGRRVRRASKKRELKAKQNMWNKKVKSRRDRLTPNSRRPGSGEGGRGKVL